MHTQLVKEEDLIVTILTSNQIIKLYRFYGARHSVINVGFLIDFEIEEDSIYVNKLRNIMQIGFPFLLDNSKMLVWQNFITLLYSHLFDVEEVDNFYYDLLVEMSKSFKRDAKRVVIEYYIKLLKFEGRLHTEFECFLCENKIYDEVKLAQGFLPACKQCIPSAGFELYKIQTLFNENKTTFLTDEEIQKIYKTLSLGI